MGREGTDKRAEDLGEERTTRSRWFYTLFLSPILVFTGVIAIGHAKLSNNEILVQFWYVVAVYLVIPISILTHIGLYSETRRTLGTADYWGALSRVVFRSWQHSLRSNRFSTVFVA